MSDSFVIPPNITLYQALNLLYVIAFTQYCNYKNQSENKSSETNSGNLTKNLSQILVYLEDGINGIKLYYKIDHLISSSLPEIRSIIDKLKTLNQNIKKDQLLLEKKNPSTPLLSSMSNHLSLSYFFKKTKIGSSKDGKCNPIKDQKISEVGISKEEKESSYPLDTKLNQVNTFTTYKLKDEDIRNMSKVSDKNKAISNERKSLDIKRPTKKTGEQVLRRSFDGGLRQQKSLPNNRQHQRSTSSVSIDSNVSKAALLAWVQKPAGDTSIGNTISVYSPRSPVSKRNISPDRQLGKKYEYVKPEIHRPKIKLSCKPLLVKERHNNLASTVVKERRERSPVSKQHSNGHLNNIAPGLETPLDLLKKRIEHTMATLQGVDEGLCKQIIDSILIIDGRVYWDDIAGLSNAKSCLKENVVYPFLRPDLFNGLREPICGMLLFGPPGTGKTMIAKAVATESNSTFFSISASSLLSKYLGESEKLVKALFYLAKRLSPSIIFVDEIDSLLTARSDNDNESSRRIKTEFLIQWSSLSNATSKRDEEGEKARRVLVLAATNVPWSIDDAARRRFSKRLYIPLPGYETRLYHLKTLLSKQKHILSDSDFELLATLTEGYSGSDITALAKEAAMEPIRDIGDRLININHDTIRNVCLDDFKKATIVIKKSVSKSSLEKFEIWASEFGSIGS